MNALDILDIRLAEMDARVAALEYSVICLQKLGLPQPTVTQIRELNNAGVSIRKIAALTGLNRGKVWRTLKVFK